MLGTFPDALVLLGFPGSQLCDTLTIIELQHYHAFLHRDPPWVVPLHQIVSKHEQKIFPTIGMKKGKMLNCVKLVCWMSCSRWGTPLWKCHSAGESSSQQRNHSLKHERYTKRSACCPAATSSLFEQKLDDTEYLFFSNLCCISSWFYA